jgi:hypothetical protein
MSVPNKKEELFVVRLFDGMDFKWMDVSDPVPKDEARKIWTQKTEDGAKSASYFDIDYYAIFPADTKMVFAYDS